jgi:hypothetical protein
METASQGDDVGNASLNGGSIVHEIELRGLVCPGDTIKLHGLVVIERVKLTGEVITVDVRDMDQVGSGRPAPRVRDRTAAFCVRQPNWRVSKQPSEHSAGKKAVLSAKARQLEDQ